MNNTLNNLALLSFKRKARKLSKNIEVVNLMNEGFSDQYFVHKGETLILWSEENGFHSIASVQQQELAYLVNFPDKYGDDEVYHFGILNFEKTKLYLYRCYEQLQNKGETLVYGLQFRMGEYLSNKEFELQQKSELMFMQQGQGSRL